jgi:acetyltransferase-like isoleucine patch superfamily enzyme
MSGKAPFIHEKAVCDTPHVGAGTRIWGFTHVLQEARIGRDCNVCEQVFIENRVVIGDSCTVKSGVSIWDGVTLEDGVFVGPNATFTNDMRPRAFLKRGTAGFKDTLIKRGASLGANCTIVCGVRVGEFAFVGAGAVVTKNVPPHALVVGNPARVVGKVCYCGDSLDSKDYCSSCKLKLSENSMEKAVRLYNV